MLEVKEWKWEKVKTKDRKEMTICCPYCNVTVRIYSDTRIFDADTGAIKYHIFKCPECYMPVTIGLDGEIIPPSRFLPFGGIQHLPAKIENMYNECRKCFANACFYSVIMLARTMIMHIAVDFGAPQNLNFVQYIDHLETEGYISRHNRTWVDKIRKMGNHYTHELDEATEDEANLAVVFIKQLLTNMYELPQMANRGV